MSSFQRPSLVPESCHSAHRNFSYPKGNNWVECGMAAQGKAQPDSCHSMVTEKPRLRGYLAQSQSDSVFRSVLAPTRPRNTVLAVIFPELRSACVGIMCFALD